MFENMRLAFQGIWSHKMRSILTMLGIIIGIAAIITIVSTIKGTNEQIKENLIGAGNNVVTVQLNQGGYTYDMSWNPLPVGVRTITEQTRKELEQHFTPEFLGRLDTIVQFAPLDHSAMEAIAAKELGKLQSRAADMGIQLILPEELSHHLGSSGKKRGGARQIRHLVQEQVEGPLAVYLLQKGKKPGKIQCTWENDKLHFTG